MKKYLLIPVILFLGLIMFTGCEKKNADEFEYTEDDYLIELDSNLATGYSWNYSMSGDGEVEIKRNYVSSCEEYVEDCGGMDQFIIKGVKEGIVTIEFVYSRQIEDSSYSTAAFVVEVSKSKKVTLKSYYGSYFEE